MGLRWWERNVTKLVVVVFLILGVWPFISLGVSGTRKATAVGEEVIVGWKSGDVAPDGLCRVLSLRTPDQRITVPAALRREIPLRAATRTGMTTEPDVVYLTYDVVGASGKHAQLELRVFTVNGPARRRLNSSAACVEEISFSRPGT